MLVPNSWEADQRNDFGEPRLLRLLVHRKAINSLIWDVCCCWLTKSCLTNSLQPHGLQNARLPCLPLFPRVYPNSCPSSRWCHPTISSSVVPFSSCLQSSPASGSFLMSQFFASGGQRIGVSASASLLPVNIQDWFPLGWSGLVSLLSRDSQESSPAAQFETINSSRYLIFFKVTEEGVDGWDGWMASPTQWT